MASSPDASPRPTPIDNPRSPFVDAKTQPRVSLDELKSNEMYRWMVARIQYHINICNREIAKFSWRARAMRYMLPMLSALVTALAATTASLIHGATTAGPLPGGAAQSQVAAAAPSNWGAIFSYSMVVLALVTTLASTLNSVMRPAVQYAHYVRYVNKFWGIRSKLDFSLEDVLISQNDSPWQVRLHETLCKRNDELEEIIGTFSDESISNIGSPSKQDGGQAAENP